MIAYIAPCVSRPALSIAAALALITLKPSSRDSIPVAVIAAYSPSECPAAASNEIPFFFAVSKHKRDIAIIAGCELQVCASSSSVPSKVTFFKSYPSISDALS